MRAIEIAPIQNLERILIAKVYQLFAECALVAGIAAICAGVEIRLRGRIT
jgi:hypothetical protein